MAMNFISNRALMVPPFGAGVDFIGWTLFPEDVPLDFNHTNAFPNPCNLGALNFDILAPVFPSRVTQGASWVGAFDNSIPDLALFTDFKPGPIIIRFNKPIRGAGANIDINEVGRFKATIKAFNGNLEVPIQSNGTRQGRSEKVGNGSAIFIGFLEDDMTVALGIDAIQFHIELLDQPTPIDKSFAISKLDLILE